MTLSEFKAWLEGYSAAIDGAPTPEQWQVIQGKLKEVVVRSVYLPDPTGLGGRLVYVKPFEVTC